MPYRTTRRNFLQGGCASALAFWLRRAEAFAQGAPSPKRFLMIHHAIGTVKSNWSCTGSETDFKLSPILAPFEPVKSHMVVLDGMDIIANGVGGGHEQGTVAVTTGMRTKELYPGNGGDDPKAAGPSVDQRFLTGSLGLKGTPIASLQVSCDDRVDVNEISARRLSYSGPAAPMEPYLVPSLTYQRVFGTLMNGNSTGDALRQARMLKKSVLDFGLRDLDKLRALAPASERARLDAHENAIRELERAFDAAPPSAVQCGLMSPPPTFQPFVDAPSNRVDDADYKTTDANKGEQDVHEAIGKLHFAVIRAAFQCDLTRVATFQWSPGTNHVAFAGLYPGDPAAIKMHHPLSHDFTNPLAPDFLTAVDTWYSQKTSDMLATLAATPDLMSGNMLDNTLVAYVTEVAKADHSYTDAPFLVFGGPGVKLQGGRLKTYNPRRPLNDLWLACGQALEVPAAQMAPLATRDMSTGALDILIS